MAQSSGSAITPRTTDGPRPDRQSSRAPRLQGRIQPSLARSRQRSEPFTEPAIRALCAADAGAFHALRLEALTRCPSAFSAGREEEALQSLEEVRARLAEDTVLGAYIDGELCGIAGFRRSTQAKKRHKGTLWGVYVRPGIRREGLGTALVAAVIERARKDVAQLHAAVVTTNRPARRLYRKLGFVAYGLEPAGLRVGDEDLDQELVVLRFGPGATGSG